MFVLALVGVVLMLTRRQWRGDLLWIGVVFVPYFLLVANYAQWWGEWCPPARYLTSVLPLLALPFSLSLTRIRGVIYKGVYALLLLLSIGEMSGFIYQPQWMYNQPNGESALLLHGLPAFLRMIPEQVRPDLALRGLFPSLVIPYFSYALQRTGSGGYLS